MLRGVTPTTGTPNEASSPSLSMVASEPGPVVVLPRVHHDRQPDVVEPPVRRNQRMTRRGDQLRVAPHAGQLAGPVEQTRQLQLRNRPDAGRGLADRTSHSGRTAPAEDLILVGQTFQATQASLH